MFNKFIVIISLLNFSLKHVNAQKNKSLLKKTNEGRALKIFDSVTKKTLFKIDSINNLIKLKLIENLTDTFNISTTQKKIDNLYNQYETYNKELIEIEFEFIKNNPNIYLSLERLDLRLRRNEGVLNLTRLGNLFNSLNSSIKLSKKGKEFSTLFSRLEKSSIGSIAPNFSQSDINNTEITLSSYKQKKYILLDFWASWCKPCREELPFLKEISNMVGNENFEIISISKDSDSIAWKKAIFLDNTEKWVHLINNEKNSICYSYFIHAIPVKILINMEGIIIGRWQGGGEENKSNLKKMLYQIFSK